MEFVIVIPALIAFVWAFLRSPGHALTDIYVPVLCLAPLTYQLTIQQLPELTFDRAAILMVTLASVLLGGIGWRFSLVDLGVLLYVGALCASELINNGLAQAQSLLFFLLATAVLPYVLAKRYLGEPDFQFRFARVLVLLLAFIAVVSLFEFRLGLNFFRTVTGAMFPGQADPRIFVQYRLGYGRIAGPFEHAIFCGMAMGIGLILQSWLAASGGWGNRLRFIPVRRLRHPWIITAVLCAGLLMTMSRGPVLAAALGLAIAAIPSMRRHPKLILRWGLIVLVCVIVAYGLAIRFTSVNPNEFARSEHELSVAYRANLFSQYERVLNERPVWGYGTITWPKSPNMRSVDNGYLQMALSYGLAGLIPFVLLLTGLAARLILSIRRAAEIDSSSAYAALGILLFYAVNLMAVFLGNQLLPLLFLTFGWGEAMVLAARKPALSPAVFVENIPDLVPINS